MKNKTVSNVGKIWLKKELRGYKTPVVFLACVSAITTLFSLVFAYLVRYLINSATGGNMPLLLTFALVLLGVMLFRIGLQTLSGYYAEKLRAKITADLRTRVFHKILRSDYAKVQSYHSGELLNRLTTDIQEVAVDTVGLLPALTGMIVQCVGAIVALLTIDPWFTLIYVVCGGVLGGISATFRKQIKKRQQQVLQADGKSRAFMQEGVSSVLTLKAYGAEEKTMQKSQAFVDEYFGARQKRNVLRSCMNAVFSLLGNFGLIFAVVWCSVSVLNGNTDYGSILSVILLLMQLQQPFTSISSLVPIYYARITSGERLHELDNLPCEGIQTKQTENRFDLSEISFENVSFTYGRNQVLLDASASIKQGEIVCLTGASGAGKSTLFKLLLNVFTPNAGALWLTNTNGEKTPLNAEWRGLFAYVPQGNFLFSGTIYENLTFFADDKDEEDMPTRVENALKVACAEFVFDLPQGLQTPLYEGGAGLSEGQLQRLAVARAIVSDRPVLLLDEATSALDSETEERLLENLHNLQNKTCLIVTHRPAALAIADRVLTVENGKIV